MWYVSWDAHLAAGGGDAFAPIVPVLRSSDLSLAPLGYRAVGGQLFDEQLTAGTCLHTTDRRNIDGPFEETRSAELARADALFKRATC